MLQDSVNSWKAFSAPAGCGSISPEKSCQMLKEVVFSWWEVKWIWWLRQDLVVQFVQLLKHRLCFHNQQEAENACFSWFLFWLIKMCLGLVKMISNSGSETEITFAPTKYCCFTGYTKNFDCVDHNKLWKSLKEMRIPDHLTCLLQNLYAG